MIRHERGQGENGMLPCGSRSESRPTRAVRRQLFSAAFWATLVWTTSPVWAEAPTENSNGPKQGQPAVIKPASPTDRSGWGAYLGRLVQQNSQGLTANRSFLYLTPFKAVGRQAEQDLLSDLASRGVLPGNLLAFAGPDSGATRAIVVNALKDVHTGWAAGSILIFIGSVKDKDEVFAALHASGATLRFLDLDSLPSMTAEVPKAPFPSVIDAPPPPPA